MYLVGFSRSVLNASARLMRDSRKYDHISPLLSDMHWLRVPVSSGRPRLLLSQHVNSDPAYLARELHWAADSYSGIERQLWLSLAVVAGGVQNKTGIRMGLVWEFPTQRAELTR